MATSKDFRCGEKVTTLRWGNRQPIGDVVAVFDVLVRVRWHEGDVSEMDPADLRFVEWDPLLEGWRTVDKPVRGE
jgi:hypothetical protein